MDKPDYYQLLGVARDADEREIKKAYRKLAMQHHPDRNPGDCAAEEQFKLASEAYEVLRDPDKRRLYDTYGHAGLSGAGFSGFGGVDDIFSQFSDIFGDLFGFGGRGRGGAGQGSDLRYDLEIEFAEAATGTKRTITVPRHIRCKVCEGSGARPGTQPQRCGTCGGRGQIHHQQGFFTLATTCPACRGKGVSIPHPCESCRGRGLERIEREVTVKIPPGVDTGNRLRVRGEGELGPQGNSPGDLYVFISVKDHPEFQRNGDDLHILREITFVQAALGADIPVTTLDGSTTLSVQPGTQPNTQALLRNMGMPSVQGQGRGNLIVHLRVTIPQKLDEVQLDCLRRYAEHTGQTTHQTPAPTPAPAEEAAS